MTINDKIISIDLNEDEGELLVIALNEYDGIAQGTGELLRTLIGAIHPSPLGNFFR